MLGSVIPGERRQVERGGVFTYPDKTDHPLIKKRAVAPDPTVQYPSMDQPHSEKHAFSQKLRDLMHQKASEKDIRAHVDKQSLMDRIRSMTGSGKGTKLKQGYEPVRENRDWRHS